ncbi:MAG: hypothetical protein E7148_08095 [Rikenellaceae bacterium]|nr:hypothetical protein [Rikenellaceae bacterium]
MRRIFSIIALLLLGNLCAQPYKSSDNRELARGSIWVYPTAEIAATRNCENNRYLTHLTTWQLHQSVFSSTFTMPFAWVNRQVFFYVGSATSDYEVRVNGRRVGRNANPNQPAEFNITRYAKEGRNTLEIVLADPSAFTPMESWKSGITPAIGATRVFSQPTLRIRDILVKTGLGDAEAKTATAEVGIVVKSHALNPRTSQFHYELLSPQGEVAAVGKQELTLSMRGEDTLRFLARIPKSQLWSVQHPVHYTLKLKTQHEGRFVEFLNLPIGFRVVSVRNGQMAVNGEPVELRVREVSPQIDSATLVKVHKEGYNTLKLASGVARPELYAMCDTLGMFVITQAAIDTRSGGDSRRKGGNISNNPAWQGAFIERVEDSYHATKRHPSVIAFSIAEQSSNGINLYETYLRMKQFEDDRPIIYPAAGGEWNSDLLKWK